MNNYKLLLCFSAILYFFSLQVNAAEVSKDMIKTELKTKNGVTFSAYVSSPKQAKAGILLTHDWFGDSDFYKDAIRYLTEEGYDVVAIDYYDGKSATTHEEAKALITAVDKAVAIDKANAGLDYLAKNLYKIGTLSFSAGTQFAFEAAKVRTDVAAIALWYGHMPTQDDSKVVLADTLVVTGSLDGDAINKSSAYLQAMNSASKQGELYVYPQAHHAFAQPLFNAGDTYDPKGAEAAWMVTSGFFERKLK